MLHIAPAEINPRHLQFLNVLHHGNGGECTVAEGRWEEEEAYPGNLHLDPNAERCYSHCHADK